MAKKRNVLFYIGIDSYSSSVWPDLKNAVLDVKAVGELLVTRYSFEVFDGSLLNNDATRENIYKSFIALKYFLEPSDNLIIFYAGHGEMNPHTHRGYWVPHDGTRNLTTLIENSVIKDFIQDIDCQHVFLISDSCFSGTFLTRTRGVVSDVSYQELDNKKSRWMIASGSEERVSDGQEGLHSPFSKYLIRFLQENLNKYACVSEIIKYVSQLTINNSKQRPNGAYIDNIGHEGGEMILILNDSFVKQENKRTRGTPNTHLLRYELRISQKGKYKIPSGKEILLIKGLIEGEFSILENFRFDDKGEKKIKFEGDSIIIDNQKVNDLVLIQRFATWQGLSKYLDKHSNLYKDLIIRSIHANKEIENVEDTIAAVTHAELLKELYDFNKDPMTCLHCGEKISTNDSCLVEIDELQLKENIGNVHAECLRPSDRVLGSSGYEDLEKGHLVNFNYSKWADLLERGQGQLNAIRNKLLDKNIKIISWNSDNIINEGPYCIKTNYEDGSSSFMMVGKNIHRFKKDKIDIEVEKLNQQLKDLMDDPISIVKETKLHGNYGLLNELKSKDHTIVKAVNFEKAQYSNQYEENIEELDNDFSPIGLVLYGGSDDIVKIDNYIPLLSNPIEFEKYYENWNKWLNSSDKFYLKIIESDKELDVLLQSFFQENLRPVINPLFNDKNKELSSGLIIESIESLIAKGQKQTTAKKWKKGDKVKVIVPGVDTDKHATGILLTDEFFDEKEDMCIIFQPIKDGKQLDLQYKMPVKLLHKWEE